MDLLSFHDKSGLPTKINEEKENTVGNSSPEESRDFPTPNPNNSFGPRKSKQIDRNRFNYKQLNEANSKKLEDLSRGKEIETNYNRILDILQNWDQKVANLLKQNEEDFLFAYKDQMFQVQKELKLLKKKIDEETLKQKTDDKINILEEERDYFRAEALRLDKLCKDQQRVIEEIKFKNKILSEDRDYYEDFVIETKKENKALKTELLGFYAQRKGKTSPLAKEKPQTAEISDGRRTKGTNFQEENIKEKDSFFQTQPLSAFSWDQKKNLVEEVRKFKANEEKLIKKIEDLKALLEKERETVKKFKGIETNEELKRGELEQILLECIDEVRREIIKRKSIMFLRENSKIPLKIEEIDYSKFSSADKRKLIEKFIGNEKILELLYFLTFSNEYTEKNRPKRLFESWKLNFSHIQQQFNQYKDFRTSLIQNSAKPIWLKEAVQTSNHMSKKAKSLIKKLQT